MKARHGLTLAVVPTLCTGVYTLDCYCKWENPKHNHSEFPHAFYGDTGGQARKEARRVGWIIHPDRTATCPKCAAEGAR